jgi:hypothetical protein
MPKYRITCSLPGMHDNSPTEIITVPVLFGTVGIYPEHSRLIYDPDGSINGYIGWNYVGPDFDNVYPGRMASLVSELEIEDTSAACFEACDNAYYSCSDACYTSCYDDELMDYDYECLDACLAACDETYFNCYDACYAEEDDFIREVQIRLLPEVLVERGHHDHLRWSNYNGNNGGKDQPTINRTPLFKNVPAVTDEAIATTDILRIYVNPEHEHYLKITKTNSNDTAVFDSAFVNRLLVADKPIGESTVLLNIPYDSYALIHNANLLVSSSPVNVEHVIVPDGETWGIQTIFYSEDDVDTFTNLATKGSRIYGRCIAANNTSKHALIQKVSEYYDDPQTEQIYRRHGFNIISIGPCWENNSTYDGVPQIDGVLVDVEPKSAADISGGKNIDIYDQLEVHLPWYQINNLDGSYMPVLAKTFSSSFLEGAKAEFGVQTYQPNATYPHTVADDLIVFWYPCMENTENNYGYYIPYPVWKTCQDGGDEYAFRHFRHLTSDVNTVMTKPAPNQGGGANTQTRTPNIVIGDEYPSLVLARPDTLYTGYLANVCSRKAVCGIYNARRYFWPDGGDPVLDREYWPSTEGYRIYTRVDFIKDSSVIYTANFSDIGQYDYTQIIVSPFVQYYEMHIYHADVSGIFQYLLNNIQISKAGANAATLGIDEIRFYYDRFYFDPALDPPNGAWTEELDQYQAGTISLSSCASTPFPFDSQQSLLTTYYGSENTENHSGTWFGVDDISGAAPPTDFTIDYSIDTALNDRTWRLTPRINMTLPAYFGAIAKTEVVLTGMQEISGGVDIYETDNDNVYYARSTNNQIFGEPFELTQTVKVGTLSPQTFAQALAEWRLPRGIEDYTVEVIIYLYAYIDQIRLGIPGGQTQRMILRSSTKTIPARP